MNKWIPLITGLVAGTVISNVCRGIPWHDGVIWMSAIPVAGAARPFQASHVYTTDWCQQWRPNQEAYDAAGNAMERDETLARWLRGEEE